MKGSTLVKNNYVSDEQEENSFDIQILLVNRDSKKKGIEKKVHFTGKIENSGLALVLTL